MNIQAISFENGAFYAHANELNLTASLKQVHNDAPAEVDIAVFESCCMQQKTCYVKVNKTLNDADAHALSFVPRQITVIYK